jgi:transposase
MAKNYRPVDRDQQFLLPPDMREWLPAHHLVWVIEALVADLDTSAFAKRRRRMTTTSTAGQAGYDPDMLLVLLLYGYSVGVRSSRAIERQCHTDVAFRVACGGDIPDHTVIARFRSEHIEAFTGLFTQVLGECVRAGMGNVGVIAIDGTKIAADASTGANRPEEYYRSLIDEITAEAAAADVADEELGVDDDDEDDEAARAGLIRSVESRTGRHQAERAERAQECVTSFDTAEPSFDERELAQSEKALAKKIEKYDRLYAALKQKYDTYHERLNTTGKRPRGSVPYHPDDQERLHSRKRAIDAMRARMAARRKGLAGNKSSQAKNRNFTDPQSRLMKTRQGYMQAYNTQFAVSDDHLIMAAEVFTEPIDFRLFQPMLTAVGREYESACGRPVEIGMALADAGYHTIENIECEGPPRLISDRKSRRLAKTDTTTEVSRHEAVQSMRQKLADPANSELYKRRGALVEPANAWVKEQRGMRRMSMRGLVKAIGEAELMATVVNIGRLCAVRGLTAPV